MVKERHHLRAHLTDESMWGGGSDYGPGSVRSGRLVIMSLRACVFVTMRFDNDNLVRLWHRLYVPDEENDVKGILHQKIFYRLNLIFWIVMGCGIAHFGRRGLKTTET